MDKYSRANAIHERHAARPRCACAGGGEIDGALPVSGSKVELTFQRESQVFSVDLIRRPNDMTPREVQELLQVSRSCRLSLFLAHPLSPTPDRSSSLFSSRELLVSICLCVCAQTRTHTLSNDSTSDEAMKDVKSSSVYFRTKCLHACMCVCMHAHANSRMRTQNQSASLQDAGRRGVPSVGSS